MSFYLEWAKTRLNRLDDTSFKKSFLELNQESLSDLESGDENVMPYIVELLLSIPISEFLDVITEDTEFASKDVFQYSDLNDALRTVCNILYYEMESMTFFEAGKRMTKSPNEYACVKYGENHLKMAQMFSLVCFDKTQKPMKALITSFGRYSIELDQESLMEMIKRLALRNPFVRSLIYNAKLSRVEYKLHVAKALSGQTIIRRKHNVEIIIKKILEGIPLIDKIGW